MEQRKERTNSMNVRAARHKLANCHSRSNAQKQEGKGCTCAQTVTCPQPGGVAGETLRSQAEELAPLMIPTRDKSHTKE